MNDESMKEILARIIGEMYDGYADPVDTPNNWARALHAADEVLEAFINPTTAMIQRGAVEVEEDHASPQSKAYDVFGVMVQAAKDGK
jgi:hypothetical protein